MNSSPSNSLPYAAIEFGVGDDLLVARVKPSSSLEPLDVKLIAQILKQSGYDNHELETDVLEQLAQMSLENKAATVDIEAHVDAKFSLDIDVFQLSLQLTYSPAFCGNDIAIETIQEAIQELGVVPDKVKLDVIEQLLQSEHKETVVIAEGKPAVNGIDGTIDVIFETDSASAPRRLEDGKVDHYETHTYVTVPAGTELMRRNPPTPGISGETIFGEAIEPVAGKDITFELNDTVACSDTDTNILIAVKSGHPIVKPNSVYIDDTLTLAQASLESGNIHFDGSVQIKGDVKPNVRVEASGDIFVEGVVENAELIAGNNIYLQSGIISGTKYDEKTTEQFEYTTELRAKNDIQLKFCHSIKVIAGGTILIENYSLHSYLQAGHDIIAGINNGKGIILGGEAHAENRMEINIIGSEAYVESQIFCANTIFLKHKYIKLQHKIERTKNELKMLNEVLEQIKSLGSPVKVGQMKLEKAKKIYREMQVLKQDLSDYSATLKSYHEKLHPANPNIIIIKKKIYPNISVVINDIKTKTSHTRNACVIEKVNNELMFN